MKSLTIIQGTRPGLLAEITTLLECEGVEFTLGGTIDLDRYRWQPPPVETPDGSWD